MKNIYDAMVFINELSKELDDISSILKSVMVNIRNNKNYDESIYDDVECKYSSLIDSKTLARDELIELIMESGEVINIMIENGCEDQISHILDDICSSINSPLADKFNVSYYLRTVVHSFCLKLIEINFKDRFKYFKKLVNELIEHRRFITYFISDLIEANEKEILASICRSFSEVFYHDTILVEILKFYSELEDDDENKEHLRITLIREINSCIDNKGARYIFSQLGDYETGIEIKVVKDTFNLIDKKYDTRQVSFDHNFCECTAYN